MTRSVDNTIDRSFKRRVRPGTTGFKGDSSAGPSDEVLKELGINAAIIAVSSAFPAIGIAAIAARLKNIPKFINIALPKIKSVLNAAKQDVKNVKSPSRVRPEGLVTSGVKQSRGEGGKFLSKTTPIPSKVSAKANELKTQIINSTPRIKRGAKIAGIAGAGVVAGTTGAGLGNAIKDALKANSSKSVPMDAIPSKVSSTSEPVDGISNSKPVVKSIAPKVFAVKPGNKAFGNSEDASTGSKRNPAIIPEIRVSAKHNRINLRGGQRDEFGRSAEIEKLKIQESAIPAGLTSLQKARRKARIKLLIDKLDQGRAIDPAIETALSKRLNKRRAKK